MIPSALKEIDEFTEQVVNMTRIKSNDRSSESCYFISIDLDKTDRSCYSIWKEELIRGGFRKSEFGFHS
jgi:hypothetical protein